VRIPGIYSFDVTAHFRVGDDDDRSNEETTRRYQLTILPR
jgi:hypothetical protein